MRQFRGCAVPDHAVPGEDDRSDSLLDQAGRLFDARPGRCGGADRLAGERLLVRAGFVLRDVLRQFDVSRPRFLRLGEFERFPEDLGDDVRALDPRIPFRDSTEQLEDVDVLVRLAVDLREVRLGGDCDERRPVEERVRHARHEVRRAGPEGREAHAGAAGQTAVDVRHERGGTFVPREDELDRAASECVHQLEVLLSRDSEGETHALALETRDQELSGVHSPAPTARGSFHPTRSGVRRVLMLGGDRDGGKDDPVSRRSADRDGRHVF